jgi:hypothetical protein
LLLDTGALVLGKKEKPGKKKKNLIVQQEPLPEPTGVITGSVVVFE